MTIRIAKKRLRQIAFSFLLAVSFDLHAFAAEAPVTSLFFTPDEIRQIEAANKTQKNVQPDIHLGAVMYYGPGDWTLWLQGERWTPATEHTDIRVLDVGPDSVHIAFTPSTDIPVREITLRPHQTYQITTDKIIEGEPQ